MPPKLDSGVIDSHVHMGNSIYGDSLSDRDFIRKMNRNGVETAVVSSFTPEDLDFEKANSSIRKMVRKYPKRFIGSITVDPRTTKTAIAILKKFLKTREFTSISLHPFEQSFKVNGEFAFSIYELAENFDCPVFLEAGYPIVSLPFQVAEASREYKKVKFVMTHCGQMEATGMSESEAYSSIVENPNIYAETSQVILTGVGGFIEQLARHKDRNMQSRIIFGSNSPFGDLALELMRVRFSNISNEIKEKIFSKNAKVLFGL
ncbi:MAG: amidohydrolase family protein [Thaumarchaeota archaeon]|nr:amidohydrolase family protein [Nitrososphaerota archaeon]